MPLDVRWSHGSPSAKHNADPDIQTYQYNENTWILRQNMAVNYEAPFLYLLLGTERAVLLDTGATANPDWFPLRTTVDALIGDHELLVLHTHPHGDHVAADAQFQDRPNTTVVNAAQSEAFPYLGLIPGDPTPVPLHLGERTVDCLATPGHHEASVTYYDRATGLLLTGDTVYPGRLYINDWPAFRTTVDRLVAFAGTHPVTHVLGCHIEMSTAPGVDYPIFTTYQPDEPPLELTVADLHAIQAAARELGDNPAPGRYPFPNFVLCPG